MHFQLAKSTGLKPIRLLDAWHSHASIMFLTGLSLQGYNEHEKEAISRNY